MSWGAVAHPDLALQDFTDPGSDRKKDLLVLFSFLRTPPVIQHCMQCLG